MTKRLLRGAYNIRPPIPRYRSTWRVSQVVTWLDSLLNRDLSLLDLSIKTVTLCVLTRPCRSAELANMDVSSFRLTPESATILPLTPPKQCQAGKPIKDYFFLYSQRIIKFAQQQHCRSTYRERVRSEGRKMNTCSSLLPSHTDQRAVLPLPDGLRQP